MTTVGYGSTACNIRGNELRGLAGFMVWFHGLQIDSTSIGSTLTTQSSTGCIQYNDVNVHVVGNEAQSLYGDPI